MFTVNRLVHAYKQAPWRVQRQWIGAFLLALLLLSMISALYLNVTARAAILGREIQELQTEVAAMQRANADLETQLGLLTSTAEMERRAGALGFRPVEPAELEYVIVPGYAPPLPEILATAGQPGLSAPSIPPEYTQSLLDWLEEFMQSPAPPKENAQ